MPFSVSSASPMVDALWLWAGETLLVAAALSAAAALGARSRGLGPASRHALWLVVLVKLMTPPLIHWPWPLPLVAGPRGAIAIAEIEPASVPTPSLAPGRRGASALPADALLAEVQTAPVVLTRGLAVAPLAVEPPPASRAEVIGREGRWSGFRWPLGGLVAAAWLVGSIAMGAGQASRVLRFHRGLRGAGPAPGWLVEEAARVGRRLGVRPPEIRAVARPGTPLLWCLGRPVLIVPEELLRTVEPRRWAAILAHELAHLRRGDPWVGRLELAAGLVWWWNPLYWLAVRRLDAEAELACDAWVIWALPKERLRYAESLLQIGSSLSSSAAPAPSLGVAGAGRFFERRLIMILRESSPCRLTPPGLLAAALLTALALPSWSFATPLPAEEDPAAAIFLLAAAEASSDEDSKPDARPEADDDVDLDVDVDVDLDVAAGESGEKDARKIEDKKERSERKGKVVWKERKEKRAKEKVDASGEEGESDDDSGIEEAMERAFGPDFEKAIEDAFGPEFEKAIEDAFGPEFEKRMEALGEQLEKKLGPGSEFEAKIKAFGRTIEEKLGPGSEFEKKMKALAAAKAAVSERREEEDGEVNVGGDRGQDAPAEARRAQEQGRKAGEQERKARAEERKAQQEERNARAAKRRAERDRDRRSARTKPEADTSPESRAARIKALESQVETIMRELKRLKAEDAEQD